MISNETTKLVRELQKNINLYTVVKLGVDETIPFLCDRFDSILIYESRHDSVDKIEEELWTQGIYHDNMEIRGYSSLDDIQEDFVVSNLAFDLAICSGPYKDRYMFCDYVMKSETKYLIMEDYQFSPVIGYGTIPNGNGWYSRVFDDLGEGTVKLFYRDEVQMLEI
jgi:hypothetical protein